MKHFVPTKHSVVAVLLFVAADVRAENFVDVEPYVDGTTPMPTRYLVRCLALNRWVELFEQHARPTLTPEQRKHFDNNMDGLYEMISKPEISKELENRGPLTEQELRSMFREANDFIQTNLNKTIPLQKAAMQCMLVGLIPSVHDE